MSLSVQVNNISRETLVITVEGELDIFTVDNLLSVIEKCDVKTIVLDCSGMRFIDSTGIGCLLSKISELKDEGRNLTLESIPTPIHEILYQMGIFEILYELNRSDG